MGWGQLLGAWLWACLAIVAVWVVVILLVRLLIRNGPGEGSYDSHTTSATAGWWSGAGRKLAAWLLHLTGATDDNPAADTVCDARTTRGWSRDHREEAADRARHH